MIIFLEIVNLGKWHQMCIKRNTSGQSKFQNLFLHIRDAYPSPPHPAPPHENQALPRPALKIDKIRRVQRGKTTDSIDTPIHYAHNRCLKGRKSRKIFSFYSLCLWLWLSSSHKHLLKMRGCNVFIYQNIIIHYKSCTFVNFLDQWFTCFLPRSAPRIFVLAPPRPSLLHMINQTYACCKSILFYFPKRNYINNFLECSIMFVQTRG